MFDAVIVGAGLAGLSLAGHLAASGWRDRSVLLVDGGAGSGGAATAWAYWSAEERLLDGAASAEYHQVVVRAGGAGSVLPLGCYRYRLVRRVDLARVVTGLMAGCPGFELRPGTVTGISSGPAGATVVVDGVPVTADWVFDARPGRPPGAGATAADAAMAFTGWEVRCVDQVFDPTRPVLLDFGVPQLGGVCFGYVLPTDAHTALVELTGFVPRGCRPPSAGARADAVGEYLRTGLGIADHRVLRTESGVLPLRVAPPPRRSGRVLAVGARAGLIKASTGYAYTAIQADSVAVAASLVRHGHPFALPGRSVPYRALDAILLEVLARQPEQLHRIFPRLFAANPTDRVLRFLDERAGPFAVARLMATLPPAPFLRALGPAAARALRR